MMSTTFELIEIAVASASPIARSNIFPCLAPGPRGDPSSEA